MAAQLTHLADEQTRLAKRRLSMRLRLTPPLKGWRRPTLVVIEIVPKLAHYAGRAATASSRAVSKLPGTGCLTEAALAVRQPCAISIPSSLARCLLLLLRSFQLPLEALQCGGSFVRSNGHLAVIAVAGAHQDGDVLESLFDKLQIISKLSLLLVCERVQMIS